MQNALFACAAPTPRFSVRACPFRWAKLGAKGGQDGPKMGQDRPKMANMSVIFGFLGVNALNYEKL